LRGNAASSLEFEKSARCRSSRWWWRLTYWHPGFHPIIDRIERLPPTVGPSRRTVTASSPALIEEFGDEWGNKWMFSLPRARDVTNLLRWRIARDARARCQRAGTRSVTAQVRARMVDRVWIRRLDATTAPQIEAGLRKCSVCSTASGYASLPVRRRRLRDFGLWGSSMEMWTDPTVGGLIGGVRHIVLDWGTACCGHARGGARILDLAGANLMPILTKGRAAILDLDAGQREGAG